MNPCALSFFTANSTSTSTFNSRPRLLSSSSGGGSSSAWPLPLFAVYSVPSQALYGVPYSLAGIADDALVEPLVAEHAAPAFLFQETWMEAHHRQEGARRAGRGRRKKINANLVDEKKKGMTYALQGAYRRLPPMAVSLSFHDNFSRWST